MEEILISICAILVVFIVGLLSQIHFLPFFKVISNIVLFLCIGFIIRLIFTKLSNNKDNSDYDLSQQEEQENRVYHSENVVFKSSIDLAKENLDIARREYNSAMAIKSDINACGRTMLNARTKLIEIGDILAGYNSQDDIEELNKITFQKDTDALFMQNR